MAIIRATIVSFSSGTFTGDIRPANSPTLTLTGVTFSRLDSAVYTAGRTVLADTGDHGDPADVVVYAVVG